MFTAKMVAALLSMVAPGTQYTATVTKVIDGDTIQVTVRAWAKTPFDPIDLRILGIDTPETRIPPAKCQQEANLGIAASAYAKTIVHVGDVVKFKYFSVDKYGGRIDATLQLPNKIDFGKAMLNSGHARAYNGGAKSDWCS